MLKYLYLFLFVCLQSDSSLTVVENTEAGEGAGSDEEEEVTVDFGDLEVVQPSEEWQTLKPGNTTGHTGPFTIVMIKRHLVLF